MRRYYRYWLKLRAYVRPALLLAALVTLALAVLA